MILSWLVYCLLVSALLGVAAWLAERAARAQEWPGRWAWAGALAGSLAFPVWARLAPASEATVAGPLPGAFVMEALPPLVLQPSTSAGVGVEGILMLGWGAVSGLLLLSLAVSAVRLRAAERRWGAEDLDGVRVLVSERTGPAALGLIRGRVVLPRWALALDARLRRLMVLHEAEHVRARDPQLALAGLLLCAAMPWNVPLWWQLGRLRLAIEMDCDARVLRRAADVRGYGALLLEVGQRRSRLALGLVETRTSLERRIRMMTRQTTGRRTLRALGLAGISGLVLAMACETPGPTDVTAEPERRPVELDDVRGIVEARDGSTACEPTFYLNGAEFPEGRDGIDRLKAEEIERIDVFKGAAAEAGGVCGAILIVGKDLTREERTAVEALAARFRSTVRPRKALAELSAAPTFTPMTQRPQLKNASEVSERLMAEYPPMLREAGIGGTTNVWFFIGSDGRVARTKINQSSGHRALDEAALRVAEVMEFTPARLEAEPTPVWVALDITFDVRTERAERPAGRLERTRAEPEERVREERVRESLPVRTPSSAAGVVSERPRFTPMTKRPQLKNREAVAEALQEHYPPLLRDAGIAGTANVWLFIDETGRVAKTAVNTSSGFAALDEAALAVASRMEFTAALNGSAPVPVWVAIDVTFERP
ncbi:MAG: M56 family metallopeptidase [Gemmatimonadetes bacterium]|nr:M56 family metallopeptidase [Gemmatimonadota bacterium]